MSHGPQHAAARTVKPVSVEPPAPPETLRCGVVGVGRMGRHHARIYSELTGAELVGVVDGSEDRRLGIAEKHGCQAFATLDELIAAGVRAVSIAAPTTFHVSIAEKLLKAGVACLVEKPLAGDVAEAQKLVDLARETGVALQVGHSERFNPVVRALQREREKAASQPGGSIVPRFIEIHRVSPMTFRSVDVSVVMDMMIHDLDIVLMLMDGEEPVDVQASGVPVVTEHADVANARLTFQRPYGRCVANITASRLALKTERKMRIIAEDAYVSIDYAKKSGTLIRRTANRLQMDAVRDEIKSGADLSSLDYSSLVNIEPLEIDDAEPLKMQLGAFLDAVRTGSRPPVDVQAGFAAVRTAERILEAMRRDW